MPNIASSSSWLLHATSGHVSKVRRPSEPPFADAAWLTVEMAAAAHETGAIASAARQALRIRCLVVHMARQRL